MAFEHRGGQSFISGLSSPGPTYALASACFDHAAKRPAKPTWGPPPAHESQKLARARTDELKFMGNQFTGELRGHFSPGPQYVLPGLMGGAPANRFAADTNLQENRVRFTSMEPAILNATGRTTLDASKLGGEPCFSLTAGSFCDPLRVDSPNEDTSSSYWRQSTTIQPGERSVTTPFERFSREKYGKRVDVTHEQLPWTEVNRGRSTYGQEMQQVERARLKARGRPVASEPLRNLTDAVADPPLANVFGALKSRSDFGQKRLGGMNNSWRESKAGDCVSIGPRFGPPPPTDGKLRSAFIQPMGVNAVPRGAPHADFDGGRITKYALERPMSETMSRSGMSTSFAYDG